MQPKSVSLEILSFDGEAPPERMQLQNVSCSMSRLYPTCEGPSTQGGFLSYKTLAIHNVGQVTGLKSHYCISRVALTFVYLAAA